MSLGKQEPGDRSEGDKKPTLLCSNAHTQTHGRRDGELTNALLKRSSHQEGQRGSSEQGNAPSSASSEVCSNLKVDLVRSRPEAVYALGEVYRGK